MTERSTETVPPRLLAALRERRGECPELEHLLEPESADAVERERIERHVELCATCAAIADPEVPVEEAAVDDVTWRRVEAELDDRERPWRRPEASPGSKAREDAVARGRAPLLALAAAVLALLGGIAIWRLADRDESVPATSGVVRGAAIQGLEPIGSLDLVDSLDAFRWRMTAPLEVELRVEVQRAEAPAETQRWTPLWSGAAAGESLEAPASLRQQLVPGAYRWRVSAVGERGAVVARSAWIGFEIE